MSRRVSARVLSAPAGGRMLPVVQRLAVGRGDLPCPRTLGLGEDLLLDLEIGPGVVVVELARASGPCAAGCGRCPPRRPCRPPIPDGDGEELVVLEGPASRRARSALSSFARASSRRLSASTWAAVSASSSR